MKDQYRKEIAWWLSELGSESDVDNYLALLRDSRLSFIGEDELKSILGIENCSKLLCKATENH